MNRIFYLAALLLTTANSVLAEDLRDPGEAVITVTLLGTGTPIPNPNQFGASTLVETSDARLLFDCGRGCAQRLWNLGHSYLRNTSHLFLTHLHSDHTVGVAELYMNGWNLGRQSTLQVFGPAAADKLMHHLRLAYEEDVILRADKQVLPVTRETLEYTVTEVVDGEKIRIGNTTVTPILVDHHVVKPAYGYRIDYGGYSVVISGDTAFSENLIRHSKDADVLVHGVMSPALEKYVRTALSHDVAEDIVALHTSAPDVGRVFAESGVRVGVLTHFDNNPKYIPELESEIRTTWDGELVIGEDLTVIEIGESIRVVSPEQ